MRLSRLLLTTIIVCAYTASVFAQSTYSGDPDFRVEGIDPLLMVDARAVVRVHEVEFDVRSVNRATQRVRRVVTIFDSSARDAGTVAVHYDGFRRLKRIDARILDASGKLVRRLRKNELRDLSAISGFSLYEDSRVRVAELQHDQYPYTVVVDYEIDHRGFIGWPRWYPLDSDASVEWARFSISAPGDIAVRYHLSGAVAEPVIIDRPGGRHYEWVAQNVIYQRPEPLGPPAWRQYPSVMAAPDRFEIAGHAGRMDTWRDFGLWYHRLSEGRAELPKSVADAVDQIQAEAASQRDLVQRLYAFMQDNTRYVSVQLGIGGWQPFDAAYVVERGYGDCKALTNYMYALLRYVGIPSYPTLIRSERYPDRLVPEFPDNQFNHAILMVPMEEEGDTLWLETTDPTAPFGHIGASNENRWALAVGPDGGELVRTPRSEAQANRQHRTGRVEMDALGGARVHLTTLYTGNQQDHMRPLARASHRERDEWIHHALDISDYRVIAADFAGIGIRAPEVELPVELNVPRFATRAGDRLFFQPNVMERRRSVPVPVDERKQEVVTSTYRYVDVDSITYVLPPNYRIEAMPDEVAIDEDFGRYEMRITQRGDGKLDFYRRLELRETTLPPEAYDVYRTFIDGIVRADRSQVVLIKQ